MSAPECGEVFRPDDGRVLVCAEEWNTEHTHDLATCRVRVLDPYECTYVDLATDVELVETSEPNR